MSVSIVGGNELWQWDTDIYINVPSDVNSIEFRYSCNRAVVGEIVDGKCRVFDSLLQKPGNLVVYSTKNNRTVEKVSFKINERPKPDGYVYTEEDVLVWTVLREDIDELSNSLAQTNENLQSVEDKVNDMQVTLDGDYNSLANKPMINGQVLSGDKSSNQFGLQPEDYKVAITGYALSLNSNRSYHEILRAFDSGKRVYATYMGKQYPLYEQQGSAFIFALINYAVNPAKASVISINSQNIVAVKDYNLTALSPNKLKFTGAVTGEFDGSQEITIDIPEGGGIIEETDPTVPDWAKQPSKPTYTAEEVGALPANTVIPTMPTKTSQLTNDSGFLTSESDPTVPSWAKASTKPTYTASEVGALPASRGDDIDANANEINQLKADMARKANTSDIPAVLPNPNKLTFSGAVTAEYDGSAPVSVEIPTGGSGGDGGSGKVLLQEAVITEPVANITLSNIDFSAYDEIEVASLLGGTHSGTIWEKLSVYIDANAYNAKSASWHTVNGIVAPEATGTPHIIKIKRCAETYIVQFSDSGKAYTQNYKESYSDANLYDLLKKIELSVTTTTFSTLTRVQVFGVK